MEFKFRANDERAPMYHPTSSSFSYVTEQARKDYYRSDLRKEMEMEKEMASGRSDGFSFLSVSSAMLSEPRLPILHQSEGISLEERLNYSAGPANGGFETLSFRHNLDPWISEVKPLSEVKPYVNLSGAERKALTPPAVGASELPLVGSKKTPKEEWSCAICQFAATNERHFTDHLQGNKHKAMEAGLRAQRKGKKFSIGLLPKKNDKPTKLAKVGDNPSSEWMEKIEEKVLQLNKTMEKIEQKLLQVNNTRESSSQIILITESSKKNDEPSLQISQDADDSKNKTDEARRKGRRHRRKGKRNLSSSEMCQIGDFCEKSMNEHEKGKTHASKEAELGAQWTDKNFGNGLFPKQTDKPTKLAKITDNPFSEKMEKMEWKSLQVNKTKESSLQIIPITESSKKNDEPSLQISQDADDSKNKNEKAGRKGRRQRKKRKQNLSSGEMCQIGAFCENSMNEHEKGKTHASKELELRAQKTEMNFGIGLFPKQTDKPTKLAKITDNPISGQTEKIERESLQVNKTTESSLPIIPITEGSKKNDEPSLQISWDADDSKNKNERAGRKGRRQRIKRKRNLSSGEMCQIGAFCEKSMNEHEKGKMHASKEAELKAQRTDMNFGIGLFPKQTDKVTKLAKITDNPISQQMEKMERKSLQVNKTTESSLPIIPITESSKKNEEPSLQISPDADDSKNNNEEAGRKGGRHRKKRIRNLSFGEMCQIGAFCEKSMNEHEKGKTHASKEAELGEQRTDMNFGIGLFPKQTDKPAELAKITDYPISEQMEKMEWISLQVNKTTESSLPIIPIRESSKKNDEPSLQISQDADDSQNKNEEAGRKGRRQRRKRNRNLCFGEMCQIGAFCEKSMNEHEQGKTHASKEAELGAQRTDMNFGIGLLPKQTDKPTELAKITDNPFSEKMEKMEWKSLQVNKTTESSLLIIPIAESLKKNDEPSLQISQNADDLKNKNEEAGRKGRRHRKQRNRNLCFGEMCQIGAFCEKSMNEHEKGKMHASKEVELKAQRTVNNFGIGLFPKQTDKPTMFAKNTDNPTSQQMEKIERKSLQVNLSRESSLQIIPITECVKKNDEPSLQVSHDTDDSKNNNEEA